MMETRFDWKQLWSPFKQKQFSLLVKLAVLILLMGLAFRVFYSNDSIGVSPLITEPSFLETTTTSAVAPAPVEVLENADAIPQKVVVEAPAPAPAEIAVQVPENKDQIIPQKEQCDLSIGDWVPDPSGPIYTNESCHVIHTHQNCMANGRPDSGYLYWRWNPRDCELKQFNAEIFLELMRNKSWAFIGDSIARNHVQSLLCILSKMEAADMVYHDEGYGCIRWHFPSYNFTLSVFWSPFLLKAATFEDINGVSSGDIQLHLDELDKKWTNQYHNYDYVVISGGQWFFKPSIYYENNTITGCNYCPGKNLTEFGPVIAYRRALEQVFNFIITSNHSSVVLLRTTTPQHFENGAWNNGGTCKRTVPFKEGEISLNEVDTELHNIELKEFEKAKILGAGKRVKLKLLDTTHLSLLRPDGHPGPYRQFHPFSDDKNAKVQNDCLHWCLPGPIDSWNDLVMEMVVNG